MDSEEQEILASQALDSLRHKIGLRFIENEHPSMTANRIYSLYTLGLGPLLKESGMNIASYRNLVQKSGR